MAQPYGSVGNFSFGHAESEDILDGCFHKRIIKFLTYEKMEVCFWVTSDDEDNWPVVVRFNDFDDYSITSPNLKAFIARIALGYFEEEDHFCGFLIPDIAQDDPVKDKVWEDESFQLSLIEADQLGDMIKLARTLSLSYKSQQALVALTPCAFEKSLSSEDLTRSLILAFLIRNPNFCHDLRLELVQKTALDPYCPAPIIRAWQTEIELTQTVLNILLNSPNSELKHFANTITIVDMSARADPFALKFRHPSLNI